jgi:hypothetical protein
LLELSDREGRERMIDAHSDDPSLRAAAAKVEELLAAHPMATSKARFELFREWLEDNPEHQTAINAYFLNSHAPASSDEKQ